MNATEKYECSYCGDIYKSIEDAAACYRYDNREIFDAQMFRRVFACEKCDTTWTKERYAQECCDEDDEKGDSDAISKTVERLDERP